jgi:hypothetical protein
VEEEDCSGWKPSTNIDQIFAINVHTSEIKSASWFPSLTITGQDLRSPAAETQNKGKLERASHLSTRQHSKFPSAVRQSWSSHPDTSFKLLIPISVA